MRAVAGDGKELDLTASCTYQKRVRDGANYDSYSIFGMPLKKDFFFCGTQFSACPIHFIWAGNVIYLSII